MLKRPNIAQHTFKKDGITYVAEAGEVLLRIHYCKEQTDTFDDIVNEDLNKGLQHENTNIIGFLQEQLKEKDSQINALLRVFEYEQKLKVVPMLQISTDEKPTALWRRIFGERGKS